MRSYEAKELFRQARKLYVDRQFEQALEILDGLADVFAAYPDLHYLRARCLGKLKRGDELREVAALLTEQFNDPRGKEIGTWFIRREPANAVNDEGFAEAAVEPPPEQPPVPRPGLTDDRALNTPPEKAEPIETAPLEQPDDETAPVAPFFDEHATSDEDDSQVSPELPEVVFEDAIPAAIPEATPGPPAAPETAGSKPKKRRRLGPIAAGVVLVAATAIGGVTLASRMTNAPPAESPPQAMPATTPVPAEPAEMDPKLPQTAPNSVESSELLEANSPQPNEMRSESTPPLEPAAPAFDLGDHAVVFVPDPDGGYRVTIESKEALTEPGPELAADAAVRTEPVLGWRIEPAFHFPFGGIDWDSVYVNASGNITFGYAESDAREERPPGHSPDVRAIAAAIDARAAAGRERMAAPFWSADTDGIRVHVRSEPDHLVLSWRGPEKHGGFVQALLRDSGELRFSYDGTPGRDGIVGVFPGIVWAGTHLGHIDDAEDASDPNVDIRAFDVEAAPSVVQFSMTLGAAVPVTVSSGQLIHRVVLDTDRGERRFGVSVTNEPRGWIDWGPEPRIVGYERDGSRLYLYVSKCSLTELSVRAARAEVDWEGYDGLSDRTEPIENLFEAHRGVLDGEIDLSQHADRRLGSIYQSF